MKYKLFDWNKPLEERPFYVDVSVSDKEAACTFYVNARGNGLWVAYTTEFGREYTQIKGTCQFSIPVSKSAQRCVLQKLFYESQEAAGVCC